MTETTHPTLYLLKTQFIDPDAGTGTFYCPDCIKIEGLLSAFHSLRQALKLEYVDFAKPRGALPDLAGHENQSCPQLVFRKGDDDISRQWSVEGIGKTRRIDNTRHIEAYLSARYDLPSRHP